MMLIANEPGFAKADEQSSVGNCVQPSTLFILPSIIAHSLLFGVWTVVFHELILKNQFVLERTEYKQCIVSAYSFQEYK